MASIKGDREPITDMIVVRRYAAANLNNLSDRLRVVFSPWIEVINKSEADVEIEEVCDEEGGCDNSRINSQTVRGD